MTHPCFAQKFCKSTINDWKLKTNLYKVSDHRGRGQSGLPQPGAAAAT